MKKRIVLQVILLVLAAFLIFYLFFSNNTHEKISGKIVYSPSQITNYCDNQNITVVWNSVFYESSDNIVIYTNSTQNNCNAIAYKNKSTELYIILLTDSNSSLGYLRNIQFIRGNFTNDSVDFFINNANKIDLTYLPLFNATSRNINITGSDFAKIYFSYSFRLDVSNENFSSTIGDGIDQFRFSSSAYPLANMTDNTGIIFKYTNLEKFDYNNFILNINLCNPNWQQVNSSCAINDIKTSWYNDTNSCNLSPNSTYTNVTNYCDFDGNGVIGNQSSITERNIDVSTYINGSNNFSLANFTSLSLIELKEGATSRVSFFYNFSNPLNLNLINIEKQPSSSSYGYLIVSGINDSKNISVDKLNSSSSTVCIENSHINSISDISFNCSGANEYLINCPGTNSSFSCSTSNNQFIISGLTSSAAREMILLSQVMACTSNWSCPEWSACVSSQQSRTCTDLNNCSINSNLRIETQTCSNPCTPSWTCTNWSVCSKNSNQSRTCSDVNSCQDSSDKPEEVMDCEYTSNVDLKRVTVYALIAILVVIILVVVYFLYKSLRKSPGNNLQNFGERSQYNY